MATSQKWKINPAQGLILATLILAAIGGTLGVISMEINNGTIDLATLGPYAPLIVNLLNGAPLIVVFIWIYNAFMYLRQNRIAALNQVTEQYDITKLVVTITWFVGLLGPVAAALPQYKAEINVIVLISTAFISELKNVWSGKTPTPLQTVSKETAALDTKATATVSSSTPAKADVTTYGPWELDTNRTQPGNVNWYKRPVYVNSMLTRYEFVVSATPPTS